MNAGRLISRGYTDAEKTFAADYAPGDVVACRRPYKRLGIDKGDELRVLGVDRRAHTATFQGNGGREVSWDPNRLAARTDDREALRETLEAVTGERIAALEAVGPEKGEGRESAAVADRTARREDDGAWARQRERVSGGGTEMVRAPKSADRDLGRQRRTPAAPSGVVGYPGLDGWMSSRTVLSAASAISTTWPVRSVPAIRSRACANEAC